MWGTWVQVYLNEGKKRVSGHLELELRVIVSFPMRVLETKLSSLARALPIVIH